MEQAEGTQGPGQLEGVMRTGCIKVSIQITTSGVVLNCRSLRLTCHELERLGLTLAVIRHLC
jgi:hypothetical protein